MPRMSSHSNPTTSWSLRVLRKAGLFPNRCPFRHAERAQRIKVAKFGGLPYISRPMRKTFAANQIATKTEPTPTVIESQTCHHGGGVFDAMRSSIANVFTGGRKL